LGVVEDEEHVAFLDSSAVVDPDLRYDAAVAIKAAESFVGSTDGQDMSPDRRFVLELRE
jgi:hypothetical protein